jgi:hypothetical protein
MRTHENAPSVTVKCYSDSGENHWFQLDYFGPQIHTNIFAPLFHSTLGFPIVSVRSESHAPGLEPLTAAIGRAWTDAKRQDQGPLFAR